jgi:hypothetical protein
MELMNIHMVAKGKTQETVKKQMRATQLIVAFGIGLSLMGCGSDDTIAQQSPPQPFMAPAVFQAAGPNLASIQNTVDQYRAALGATDNGNTAGPLADGRREINWDGAGGAATNTAPAPTPFEGFRNNRGARFTTPGTGFVQATAQGLTDHFANQSYVAIFQPFSNQRLFGSDGSTVTNVEFFVPIGANVPPGTLADKPATTKGFGAVFTDVDQPNGSGPNHINGDRSASTLIEYFGTDGGLLFKSVVPASPGEKAVSFLGIVFTDARIAKVKIISGDTAPVRGAGPNDDATHDIVMMDDFLYGEPQQIP